MAAGELPLTLPSPSPICGFDEDDGPLRAISLAVAMAGVVVVDAGGGGEVSRVGFRGGEGAKISLGGGGATRIYPVNFPP